MGEKITHWLLLGSSPQATIPSWYQYQGETVACADGGYHLAQTMKLVPQYLLGDMDSLGDVPKGSFHTLVLPREKDDTDMMALARLAVEQGCKEALLLGCLGGRLDHTYGNFSVLQFLAEAGVSSALADGDTYVQVLLPREEPYALRQCHGKTVSVFPFGNDRCCVSYENLKYSLQHGVLMASYPLGVSNEMACEKASIAVHEGAVLVIQIQ